MKAVGLLKYLPIDNEESLFDFETEKPTLEEESTILVQVKAISVNPVDFKMRSPKEKVEAKPRILGWDAAGVVVEVGSKVTRFKAGDEVYYAGTPNRPGCNAEYQIVDEDLAGHKPKTLSFAEAAAYPLTMVTAYEALFDRMGLTFDTEKNKGKTILIINGAGGVGSNAIQLAKLAGFTVIATTSRPETNAWAQQYQPDFIINHKEDLPTQLKALGFPNTDYILCLYDTGVYWKTMAEIIAIQGKICSIVETNELVSLNLIKNKSVSFIWELMFTRSMFRTVDMYRQSEILDEVAGLIDAGKIKNIINPDLLLSPINAANLRKAHAQLEANTAIGKIVLEGWE